MRKLICLAFMFLVICFVFGCNEQNEIEEGNLSSVFYGVFENVDVTNITEDIELPKTVGDVEFVWESSNQDVFSNTGEVNRKEADCTITLKATLKYNDKKEEFNIVLIVIGLGKANEYEEFDQAFSVIIDGIDLAEVTEDIELPIEYEGINIIWESSMPNILSPEGIVVSTNKDVKVTLKATLYKDNKVKEYLIDLIVKAAENDEYYSIEKLNKYNGVIEVTFRVPSGIISKSLESLIPEFERNWNGKIDVKLDIEASGYDGVRKTTILDINSMTAPTIVLGYADHFADYYETGYLLNLQPYVDMEKDLNIDDFIQSYLDENRIVTNSKDLYGMPLNKSTEVLCYNKTVFDYMGYKVPTTWQEVETLGNTMISDVRAGKLDNIPGIVFAKGEKKPSELLAAGQFYPIAYDSTSNAFITMCKQWNAAYTEKDDIEHGYAMFNNAECKAGLTYFQNLAKDGLYAVAETFDSNYASDAFKLMKTVMTVGSSAGIGYNTNTKFNVGIAKAPYNAENPNDKYVIQQGTNMAILNQSNSYQKAAAWQLLKWLTSTEITAKFCIAAGGYVPVRKSAFENEDYKEFLDYPAIDDTDYSNSANVALTYINEGYKFFFDPAFVGSADVRDNVGILMSNVIVNKKDINKAIDDALSSLGPSYQK